MDDRHLSGSNGLSFILYILMVSLCLTKPHIDGRVSDVGCYSDLPKSVRKEKTTQKPLFQRHTLKNADKSFTRNNTETSQSTEVEHEAVLNQTYFQKNKLDLAKAKTAENLFPNLPDAAVDLKFNRKSEWSRKNSEKLLFYREESVESQRSKMLATVRAMGNQKHRRKTSSRLQRRFIRQYSQYIPDARKDRYFIHKWRVKSGRVIDVKPSEQRPVIQSQQKLKKLKEIRETNLKKKTLDSLYHNVESRYKVQAVPKTSMLQGKEELFGISRTKTDKIEQQHYQRGSKRHTLLPRLRNQLQRLDNPDLPHSDLEIFQDSSLAHHSSQETENLPSEFEAMQMNRDISLMPNIQPKRRGSVALATRSNVLPPIISSRRRQSLPMRRRSLQPDQSSGLLNKRRVSLNPATSPMAIPENEILNPPLVQLKKRNSSSDMPIAKYEKIDNESVEHAKVLGGSPVQKKSHSSMTMHSYSTTRTGSKEGKDGDTPTDSEGSLGPSKYRRTRKMRGSRILTKMESRNSPQFRYIKPYRMDVLMRQWYISVKLTIWLARLYKAHRVVVDDSYNIHSGSNASEEEIGNNIKKEVLFDVTDYKMKNQLRLSDTTRRVLLLPQEKRTEKDVNLVQTALRNIKAIADYSNVVQKQIGKQGYFVGFEGKRVVIRENKRPLNYYLLLAGSAVVIKSDELGNTNPVLFMKRGDIFGEKEILEDMRWQWSVATSGYCEFLLLDREDYKNIFITGGGGGLLSDPDRGGFLRSIELLHHWPIALLGDNPNRCLFRYFKRGALLVHDSNESEWIYVIKSGSCSVLKQLQVEPLSENEILLRLKKVQKFRSKLSANPRLVEETEPIEQEEHVNHLLEKEEKEKNKEVSVFQQLEMSSILKELNPDVIGTTVSPRAEAGFDDFRSEFPLSSYKADIKRSNLRHTDQERNQENGKHTEEDKEDFRLSRHSDRHPPRTPSPTKAAYLRTGISTRSAKRDSGSRLDEVEKKYDVPPEIIVTDVQQPKDSPSRLISPQKQVHIKEFLFGSNSPEELEDATQEELLQQVHINVRQLTKRDVFGMEPHLYSNQPSLTLVSNGAECLMLNKKFYLENANEDCMKFLREAGYPYPTDTELEEQHWRVLTWKAYQSTVIRELLTEKEGFHNILEQ